MVAGIACHALRMFLRNNLRKSAGFRGVLRMASHAQRCYVRSHRLDRCRVFRVICQRPMARFTVHVRMNPFGFHFQHIGMTAFACVMACIMNGAGHHLRQRIASIMSVSAETLGDHGSTEYCEHNRSQEKHRSQSGQVCRVLELTHASSRCRKVWIDWEG